MKTLYTLTILAIFGFVGTGTAQQLPFSSQYFTNMFTVNPAFTGVDEYGQIFLSHRSQYARLEGGPQTSYMSIDGKVGDNIGLGLIAFHDQTDLLSRTSAMANYSYALHFSGNHYLTMGIAAGVQNNTVDYDKAMVVDANDPILFSTRQNRTVFNADIGLGYRWNALQAGIAIPQLLIKQPDFTDNTGSSIIYNNTRHFRGTLRYDFTVNDAKGIIAYPLVMVRAVKGAPVQWDFNAIVDYKKLGWIGLSYHSNYAVSVSAGIRYKNLSAGYSQDIIIGQVSNYSKRSSEFVLIYHMGEKWRKQKEWNAEIEGRMASAESESERQQTEIDQLKKETEDLTERLRKTEEQLQNNQVVHDSIKTDVKELQDAIEKVPFQTAEEKPSTSGINIGEAKNYRVEHFSTDTHTVEQSLDSAPLGYYVVVGAFGVKSNAYRQHAACIAQGQLQTKILFNKNNELREVFIFYTTNEAEAVAYKNQFTETYPKIWVLRLQ